MSEEKNENQPKLERPEPQTDNSGALDLSGPKSEIEFVYQLTAKVKSEIQKVMIGQDRLIDLLLAGLLCEGHILIEGVPGIAKTLVVRLISQTLNADFKRIQFTPDLMPSDVIGTSVYNMKTSEFYFRKGPVFSNLILIDEINRAPAKTQAALFEVMEERQVTVDGETHQMEFPLFIAATQNPIEQEGTYKLPEAQLDRFLFRIKISYPNLDEEKQILHRFKTAKGTELEKSVKKILKPKDLQKCMDIINTVHIKDELVNYIAKLVHHTRETGDLFLGASPRASLAIMRTSKAYAALQGRDFVIPDDIQYMAYPVLNHRIILSPEREMEGLEPEDIIKEIIQKVEVPR